MTERNEATEPQGTTATATEEKPPVRRTRFEGLDGPLLIGGRRGNSVDVVVLTGTVFSAQMRQARRGGALGHTGRRGVQR